MVKGLVNILTPAYNSGRFIHRLLDSVLKQSYHNISMYVVDDGSTDNTAEIIKTYIPKFEARGYSLKYIYQKNQGQSYAINNGLKYLEGEYLFWPDSDDWYSREDSISKLTAALDKSSEDIGIVRCRYQMVKELTDGSYNPIYTTDFDGDVSARYLLKDAVTRDNGFRWEPGGYGIKLKYLDALIKNREIITGPGLGQNAQLLLPYFAKFKCISVDEILFNYLVRDDSHSRGFFSGYDKVMEREEGHRKLISEVLHNLRNISIINVDEIIRLNDISFYNQMLNIAINENKSNEIVRIVNLLRQRGRDMSKQESLIYFFSKYLKCPAMSKKLLSILRLSRY